MKILTSVVMVASLWLSRPAAGDIEYGPYTFPDGAFADVATNLGFGPVQVFPAKVALCRQGTPDVLIGVLQLGFSFMDVVFLAIVVYQAWKIPAPMRIGV